MPLTKVTGGEIDGASSINVTGIVTATSFSGDVSGNINSSGVSTFSTLRVGTGVTISSGVVTATSFVGNLTGNVTGNVTGNATGLSGTPSISVNSITAATATFTGNVSVAGTVTYEDVTNVDSIGIVTARGGLQVGTGGTVITTTTGGLVGIGTANPSTVLNIVGGSIPVKINNTSSDGLQIIRQSKTLGLNANYDNADTHCLITASSGMDLAFATNGDFEKVRITGIGSIGIGLTNPNARLTIKSFGANTTPLNIQNSGNTSIFKISQSTGGSGILELRDSTDKTYMIADSSTGLVGIGTANPGYQVIIFGSTPQLAVQHSGTNRSRALIEATDSAVYYGQTYGLNNIPVIFSQAGTTSGVERFRIDTNGNIGIGTTNPSNKLHITGSSSNGNIRIDGSNNPYIQLADNSSNTGYLQISSGLLDLYHNGNITFSPGTSQKVIINSSGNLGIGTTNPSSARLQILSPASTIPLFYFRAGGDPTNYGSFVSAGGTSIAYLGGGNGGAVSAGTAVDFAIRAENNLIFAKGNAEIARFDTSGNLGIGTNTPSQKLDVRGTFNIGGGSEGIRLGNVGDNTPYDNVKLYYTGYNSGNPYVYLTPRTQPGSGNVNTYLHLQSNNIGGPGANNMGLLVDGSVGIGTNNPTVKLDVLGKANIGGSFYNSSISLSVNGIGETYNPNGAISNRDPYLNAGTITGFAAAPNSVNSACLIDFNAYNSSNGATDVYIGGVAGPSGNGPANFVVGRRTSTQTWAESLRVNTSGNLGIGTINPTAKLHVQGDAIITSSASINGVPQTNSISYEPTSYFTIQQHLENNNLTCFTTIGGTLPTYVTENNTTTPYSKAALFSNYWEGGSGDYIPVTPGETIYGEIWVKRNTGATGTAGQFFCGIARYDKDKNPIAGNLALTYFLAGSVTIPTDSTWAKYSGTTTLPLSHTPFSGSDGGPVRYIRPYLIVNYTTGTIPTYVTGFSIKKQGVFGSENVGINTTSPTEKLEVNGNLLVGSPIYNNTSSPIIRIGHQSGNLADGTQRGVIQFDSIQDISVNTGDSWKWKIATVARPGSSGNYNSQLEILRTTRFGVTDNTDFCISRTGNVGIALTNPTEKLDVKGSISAAGRNLNVPHIMVKNSSGDITYFEYYFTLFKGSSGTAINKNILSVASLSSFHQAAFTVEYGTRLQGVSDATTSVCLKQFGVNKFNSGNVAITDTNDIASDTNSNTHANVTCITNGASGYIIRGEFSSTLSDSSFISGVLRGWGVSDSFNANGGTVATLTFTNGPT